MISVRVKTQLLEIAVASDNSSLGEVVEAAIKVGQSQPVQASLQEPIILKQLPIQAELPSFLQPGNGPAEQRQQQKKKPAGGKGERVIAYEKILELKSKDFFSGSSKNFAEIQSALSTMGYTIKNNRLGDALLKLVRDGHLAREGEKNSYVYRAP
ncbi:hypothetical protein [Nitrososphaera sp.]|uniref:hypothetical protein n=1 Tax=Nitrososphaera sp. TaxID=1971748 RepID=UPI00307E860D